VNAITLVRVKPSGPITGKEVFDTITNYKRLKESVPYREI